MREFSQSSMQIQSRKGFVHNWNGFRIIEPYYYKHETFVKGRWIGKRLLEMFLSEFRDRPVKYYELCCKNGSLLWNNEKITEAQLANRRLKFNEILTHKIHRHEPLVPDANIEVLSLDKETGMAVVVKPAGIPCHPTGKFYYNSVNLMLEDMHSSDLVDSEELQLPDFLQDIDESTLTEIELNIRRSKQKRYKAIQETSKKRKLPERKLARQGKPVLANVNRLDRLVSGILLIGFKSSKSLDLHTKMKSRKYLSKAYLAKVYGRFPESMPEFVSYYRKDDPESPYLRQRENEASFIGNSAPGFWIHEPVYCVDHKTSLCAVAPIEFKLALETSQNLAAGASQEAIDAYYIGATTTEGTCKSASTFFQPLHYDPSTNTSLVRCFPFTGRTHQIRIHLQFIGYPIVGDSLYSDNDLTSKQRLRLEDPSIDRFSRSSSEGIWCKFKKQVDDRYSHQDLLTISRMVFTDLLPKNYHEIINFADDYFSSGLLELKELINELSLVNHDRLSELLMPPAWFDKDCDECQRQWIRSLKSYKHPEFLKYVLKKTPSPTPDGHGPATEAEFAFPSLVKIIQSHDTTLDHVSTYIPLVVPLDTTYSPNHICLHALRYASYDPDDPWSYETPLPSWANLS